MLEFPGAVALLTIMEILGPIILLIGLVYAGMRAGRRRQRDLPAADAATREVYRDPGPKED